MSRHNTFHNSRLSTTATTVGTLLIASLFALPASAQSDPIEFGAAQLPYVMILMDTSASMEWTDQGDAAYPTLEKPLPPDKHLTTWIPGSSLQLENDAPTLESVGPCYVWKPACDIYERPSSCADQTSCGELWNSPAYSDVDSVIEAMRQSDTMRLTDRNMPRHVMIKEILAGDMVLNGSQNQGNAENRPGCWFVPRFKSAALDAAICTNSDRFKNLIDADDPRPHIQEVYDSRRNNGLLERMSNTVLLGVTMFDGYQFDGNGWGMNDILAGNSPNATYPGLLGRTGDPAIKHEEHYSNNPNDGRNYDLGIYRVIGPSTLQISLDKTQAVSRYVQKAIADAGYISERNTEEYKLIPDGDNTTFLDPYLLAKQPMAGATPLGAAMHDIYQFFLHGQHQEKQDDWRRGNHTRHTGQITNPFDAASDTHRSCRPKHVIILTDGYPEPEAPDGAGNEIGFENMDAGFGYDLDRYPYGVTENIIEKFVGDADLGVDPDGDYKKYMPRVHIIGVNVDEGVLSNEDELEPGDMLSENTFDVITKLAVMAAKGNTCAQYYVPSSMIPPGYFTRETELDDDGEPQLIEGSCNLTTDVCLLPQSNLGGSGEFTGFPYYPNGPGTDEEFPCKLPALILNRNDKSAIRSAFQSVFNEIISSSGMASRTRPSMTSYLDLPKNIGGQYRMYAGVKMEGGNPYWKGILNQESLQCDANGELSAPPVANTPLEAFRSLHNEISHLRISLNDATTGSLTMERKDVEKDRRRVFTMIPTKNWYNYETDRGSHHSMPQADRAIRLTGDKDEFGLAHVSTTASGAANEAPRGIRVPFEHTTLLDAYLGSDKPFGADNQAFYNYLGIRDSDNDALAIENLRQLVHEVRGRNEDKFDRVLGGIFQSNPVTVGPPDLAVPIDSYREFSVRHSDRPTMLYVGTLDGQLHAIYTGQPNVIHREESGPADAGSGAKDVAVSENVFAQREAWAYVPHMLHRELQINSQTQPRLLDGTPVVMDVRLCHANKNLNTNAHACANVGDTNIPPAEQWRTVLVQGLGDSGRGYFALDVTRPGDAQHAPDPIPLWEFNDKWEFGQLQAQSATQSLFGPDVASGTSPSCGSINQNGDTIKEWQTPYMGSSVGEAAIGTVTIKGNRKAVAVFSAGLSSTPALDTDKFGNCSGQDRIGRAIYVVDLQNGQMLRRFVDYHDGTAFKKFQADVVGTPALFDEFPGSLVTRGFVGDAAGALFRIDLSGGDPEDWKVTQFFNPKTYTEDVIDITPHGNTDFGPASFRPAISMSADRRLVVVYGLGTRGDTETHDQTQFIIALKESAETENGNTTIISTPLWVERFSRSEKLTGEPVVFNNAVYFTTYHKEDSDDACEMGRSRIWALGFEPDDNTSLGQWPMANFDETDENFEFDPSIVDGNIKWFGPSKPTLIRGVAITMGASCADAFDEEGVERPFSEGAARTPQLIAQTGSTATGSDGPGSGSGSGSQSGGLIPDVINTISVDLPQPRLQSIPLSWTVITN